MVLLRTETNDPLGEIHVEEREQQATHRRVDTLSIHTHFIFPQLVREVRDPTLFLVFVQTATQSIGTVRADDRLISGILPHILSHVVRMDQKGHQPDEHDSFRAQDACCRLDERPFPCLPSIRVGERCLRGRRTSFRTGHSSQTRAHEQTDECLRQPDDDSGRRGECLWRGNGRTRSSTVGREEKRDEHGTQDVVMVANQLAEVTDVQIDHEVAVL